MFRFGGFDAFDVDGFTAVLDGWTNLPGLSVELVEAPGIEGAFFGEAELGPGSWTFTVRAVAPTAQEVLAVSDRVVAACHPRHGLQDLTIDVAPGWRWRAVVSQPIAWERGEWQPGGRCELTAKLVFLCPDPHAYATPDESATRTGAGSLVLTRERGNADSYPTIEVTGSLSSGQSATVTVGGVPVTVQGPLAADETMRLDYQAQEFGVWAGGTKRASLVGRMSTLERLTLPLGATTVSLAGAGGGLTVWANSRRS